MRIQNLVKKFHRVFKEEGLAVALGRVLHFAGNRDGRKERREDWKKARKEQGEVLFINGYYSENPVRYRVLHQMEQLRIAGVSCNKVYFEDLDLSMEQNYQKFIFYRCSYTELVGQFIQLGKQHNKKVYFDIDDLVFDVSYTDQIPFVREMSVETKKVFDEIVESVQKTLCLCDAAITTTETLAEELAKFVPETYVNRNCASQEMVVCAEKAYKEHQRKDDGKIWLGYFSGSHTHNADFDIIRPVLIRIMNEYPQVHILLVGELDFAEELQEYRTRIRVEKMRDWRRLPELIAQVDINLAPLEDSLFNRAKSEIKWIEAALVRVPTVASRVGAFERMIKDYSTGILSDNTEYEWYLSLKRLINDAKERNKIGNEAYVFVMKECVTTQMPKGIL